MQMLHSLSPPIINMLKQLTAPGTDVITVTTVLARIASPARFHAAAARGGARFVAISHAMIGAVRPMRTSQLRPCHVTCKGSVVGEWAAAYAGHQCLW